MVILLALLSVFLFVCAGIVAKTIVWAVVEKPSLYEIKNAGLFGITGVIIATVVGLLTGVTGSFWIVTSLILVACLICFGIGEKSGQANM